MYFGGNGEAVALSANEFSCEFSGMAVYLHNYKAYGGSKGRPSEMNLYSDALALYDLVALYTCECIDNGKKFGIGYCYLYRC